VRLVTLVSCMSDSRCGPHGDNDVGGSTEENLQMDAGGGNHNSPFLKAPTRISHLSSIDLLVAHVPQASY
jgi:hypothetical protein